MRALVTGSAGFVGRHMVIELLSRGYDVTSVDLEAMGVTFDPVGPAHLHVIWDCRRFFAERDDIFDLVVHCAFHVGGRAAIDGEPRLLARNLELDAAMFDWAVRTGQRRVLYFSSSAAYPVDLQNDFATAVELAEDDIRFDRVNIGRPDARYGWAKLTGEQLARAAGESGLPVHVVRPFSGYGGDQSLDYPFSSFIDRARRRADPFTIWGPGTQVRDWVHIDDVIAGALAVVDVDCREPVNLCTGVGTSMLELATLCCAAAGYEPVFALKPDAPTGVAYRVGDPGRLHQFYKPKLTLAEGVERALRER